jgi:FAD synthase
LFPQVIYDHYEVSSTTIRHAILAGEIELANDLLGYNFILEGEFDNQRFTPDNKYKIIPAYGIYKCILKTDKFQEGVVCEVNKKIKIKTTLSEDFEDDCCLEFVAKLDE